MTKTIDALRAEVRSDPGCDAFVELAKKLNDAPATRAEAREICFRGLAANPGNLLGRLTLAHSFYLDELGEFCVRELVELKKRSDAPALDRLLDSFGEFAAPFLTTAGEKAESASRTPTGAPSKAGAGAAATAKASSGKGEAVVAELDLDVDFSDAFDELE